MKTKIFSKIKPLYDELLSTYAKNGDCAFCVQWGEEFPTEKGEGVMFVGRAVNGWITDELDVEYLFNQSNDERIFNRTDQIAWFHTSRGSVDSYNTGTSAFHRVVRQTAETIHSADDWYKKIAWSNLCKLAPFEGGNPSDRCYYEQLEINKKILFAEIEALKPKVVVFLTRMDWVKEYFDSLVEPIKTYNWSRYASSLYKIDDYHIIISEHPQGKKEADHIKALVELIKEI